MTNAHVENPIYNFVNIDLSEISDYPNGLRDIYARKIDGLIIHNVYSREDVAVLVDRLERNEPQLTSTEMPWGSTIGQVLVRAELAQYYVSATRFRNECRQLFAGLADFEQRIADVAHSMSGGLPVEIPTNVVGDSYTPATIRILGEGGALALHCGNQFLHELPEFGHLASILELEDQLSYFMTIAEPEAGGELMVYDIEWGQTPNSMVDGKPIRQVIDQFKCLPINPPPGAVLFFDGGRIWHQVMAVKGATRRVTIGGFAAFSRDHQKVYYWS